MIRAVECSDILYGVKTIDCAYGKNITVLTPSEAHEDIYLKLRPGEPPNAEQAGQLLLGMFFTNKKYDLAKVGRYKISGLEDDGQGQVKHGKLTHEYEALGFERREDHVLTREDCFSTKSSLV